MKKIVILSAFATPFRSGAEACAEEVAAALQDRYDITIVTAKLRKDLPHLDTLPSGVRVWRLGLGRPIDKWLFPFLAPRAVNALKPDVVHAVLETFAGLALRRCSKTFKQILTCQTTNRTFLKGPVVRAPHTVTAISRVLVSQIESLGRTGVVLIPNGIRLNDLQQARAKHAKVPGHILFVGRLEQMKGVDILLRAFAIVREKLENQEAMRDERLAMSSSQLKAHSLKPHLRIVGDGSQRQTLERLAHDLQLDGHVTFVGYVPPDQVANEFAQAEIFCGLSRSEALGNVFLEAQAAGCAVIGTTVGGIPDIVQEGVTGLLVAPDGVDAAASAIERVMTDASLKATLSAAGEEHAKAYDWKIIAERYATLYN